jgi:hypothetical protein
MDSQLPKMVVLYITGEDTQRAMPCLTKSIIAASDAWNLTEPGSFLQCPLSDLPRYLTTSDTDHSFYQEF